MEKKNFFLKFLKFLKLLAFDFKVLKVFKVFKIFNRVVLTNKQTMNNRVPEQTIFFIDGSFVH
jgi:hypothetical protein